MTWWQVKVHIDRKTNENYVTVEEAPLEVMAELRESLYEKPFKAGYSTYYAPTKEAAIKHYLKDKKRIKDKAKTTLAQAQEQFLLALNTVQKHLTEED